MVWGGVNMKTKLLVLVLILLIYFKGNVSLADDDTLTSHANQNKQNLLAIWNSQIQFL